MKSYWQGKKVLVAGASGFIGSHVVDDLVDLGAKVVAQVSGSNQSYSNLQKIHNVRVVKGNLLDPSFCLNIIKCCDVILNCAGLDGGTKYKSEHSAEIFRTNSQI